MSLIAVGSTPYGLFPSGGDSMLIQNLDTTNTVYFDGNPNVSTSGPNQGVAILPGGDTGWIPFVRGEIWVVCASGLTVNVLVAHV